GGEEQQYVALRLGCSGRRLHLKFGHEVFITFRNVSIVVRNVESGVADKAPESWVRAKRITVPASIRSAVAASCESVDSPICWFCSSSSTRIGSISSPAVTEKYLIRVRSSGTVRSS